MQKTNEWMKEQKNKIHIGIIPFNSNLKVLCGVKKFNDNFIILGNFLDRINDIVFYRDLVSFLDEHNICKRCLKGDKVRDYIREYDSISEQLGMLLYKIKE